MKFATRPGMLAAGLSRASVRRRQASGVGVICVVCETFSKVVEGALRSDVKFRRLEEGHMLLAIKHAKTSNHCDMTIVA